MVSSLNNNNSTISKTLKPSVSNFHISDVVVEIIFFIGRFRSELDIFLHMNKQERQKIFGAGPKKVEVKS